MISLNNLFKENKNNYQIYQDMDGCLCDFESHFKYLTGMSPDYYLAKMTQKYGSKKAIEMFWDPIAKAGKDFWANLYWMPDGQQLWDYIKQYNPKLLTAPSREKSSRIGKQEWVDKHIPGTPIIFKKAEDKKDLADPNSILIDDRKSNIEQWINAGGIGIYHTSTASTIKKLKQIRL